MFSGLSYYDVTWSWNLKPDWLIKFWAEKSERNKHPVGKVQKLFCQEVNEVQMQELQNFCEELQGIYYFETFVSILKSRYFRPNVFVHLTGLLNWKHSDNAHSANFNYNYSVLLLSCNYYSKMHCWCRVECLKQRWNTILFAVTHHDVFKKSVELRIFFVRKDLANYIYYF